MITWHALHIEAPPGAVEAVLAWAWEGDITGVEEDAEHPGRLTLYARRPWDVEAARAGIAARLALVGEGARAHVSATSFPEEDWFAPWKRSWRPTPLGAGLLVVPSWWEDAIPGDRAALWLDPGPAFGTGAHVTTALAWELLETSLPARRLLDVGAGSGVLSLGAMLLCETLRGVATELDPGAARALAANVARAGLVDRCLPVRTRGVPCGWGAFDLAVANLTALEHVWVAGALVHAMAPAARVVISGLRDTDATVNSLPDKGFRRESRIAREGWRAERWVRP